MYVLVESKDDPNQPQACLLLAAANQYKHVFTGLDQNKLALISFSFADLGQKASVMLVLNFFKLLFLFLATIIPYDWLCLSVQECAYISKILFNAMKVALGVGDFRV